MCGISAVKIKTKDHKFFELLKASEIRGQDGTGIASLDDSFNIRIYDCKASEAELPVIESGSIIGQNRLAIHGLSIENNQPLNGLKFALVHNGNLLHFEEEFVKQGLERNLQVDTELILRMLEKYNNLLEISKLRGNFACIGLHKASGHILGFCKDKPLWHYEDDTGRYLFSTERIGRKVFGDKKFTEVKEAILF